MSKRYPIGRRRRPGRRPPNRYSGRFDRPAGFTPSPLRAFYRVMLPGLRGRQKREFFNGAAAWMILGFGLGGAVLGLAWLGPLGALLGLGVGLAAGSSFAEGQRFYRR